VSAEALARLSEILDGGGDVDDALRAAVGELVTEPSIVWAGIRFLEEGGLLLGPSAGKPDEARRVTTPITYRDSTVGELVVDGDAEGAFLEQVARLISPHVLLGWDTGGEVWVP
jgi:hypothetical protein